MQPPKKSLQTVGDNETFVRLMQVAREDSKIGSALSKILSANRPDRQMILKFFLVEMRDRKAPADFITAMSCLLDDKVADKALEYIKQQKPTEAG